MEFCEKKFIEFAELIDGKWWHKAGKKRIYFDVDKTAKAFLEYDSDATEPHDSFCLRVYSDCWSQSIQWNVNRAKQIKHGLMLRLAPILNLEVCADWREVIL